MLLQNGEAYAGGEVLDGQRQFAFDLIKEVKRIVNTADNRFVCIRITSINYF